MTADDFIDEIVKDGWHFEREGKGSHRIYKHPTKKGTISVPYHGSKDLGKGLLSKLKKIARG